MNAQSARVSEKTGRALALGDVVAALAVFKTEGKGHHCNLNDP